jgi:hypothetical protein
MQDYSGNPALGPLRSPPTTPKMAQAVPTDVRQWLSDQVSILLGFQADEAVDYLLTFTSAEELQQYVSDFFGNSDASKELASGLIQRMSFEVRSASLQNNLRKQFTL